MKAKVLLIAGAAAIVGTGVVMHTTGGKPKCPLQMLMHPEKQETKAKTAVVEPLRTGSIPADVVKNGPAYK